MVAPNQRVYEKEAKDLECPKMLTLSWCKMRTDYDGSACYTVLHCAVYSRDWKFAEIRSFLLPGAIVAPNQGAYEKEAKDVECPKMLTLSWCKKPTYLDGSD